MNCARRRAEPSSSSPSPSLSPPPSFSLPLPLPLAFACSSQLLYVELQADARACRAARGTIRHRAARGWVRARARHTTRCRPAGPRAAPTPREERPPRTRPASLANAPHAEARATRRDESSCLLRESSHISVGPTRTSRPSPPPPSPPSLPPLQYREELSDRCLSYLDLSRDCNMAVLHEVKSRRRVASEMGRAPSLFRQGGGGAAHRRPAACGLAPVVPPPSGGSAMRARTCSGRPCRASAELVPSFWQGLPAHGRRGPARVRRGRAARRDRGRSVGRRDRRHHLLCPTRLAARQDMPIGRTAPSPTGTQRARATATRRAARRRAICGVVWEDGAEEDA